MPAPVPVLSLARLAVHLAVGLLKAALLFPWFDAAGRDRRIQCWSAQLVRQRFCLIMRARRNSHPPASPAKSLRSLDKKIARELGAMPVNTVSVADCARFIEDEAAQGKSRSAQALRSRLMAAFNRAVNLGWTDTNPAEPTANPKAPVERGRLTLETYRLIYEAAPQVNEWLQHAMRLALITGQDRKTVAGLKRSMVSTIEGERVLIVQRSKTQATNKPVAIPLRLRLDAIGMTLEDALAHRTGVVSPYYLHHVAPHSNAAPGDPVFLDRISKCFTEARKLAGLPDEAAPTFHELRSLSKRLYERQGGIDTKALLGHASERAANLYADPRGVEALLVKVS